MRLDGKIAVITGTSPNIGGGIAEGLCAEGAAVVCVDSNPNNAADCARSIAGAGGRALAITCDVTSEAQVKSAVDAACGHFGGIDILVNNAVLFIRKGVLTMSLDEWQRQLAVMLDGAFLFTKHVAQSMIAGGRHGSIINIISTAGHQGEPGNIAYCTGKSGLLNFTRSAAMELIRHGIRVN
ncbi:MAG: SDR family NAD(P)-dependent oxidoreductase, partial [Candidatus Binataceae bacterium]